MKILLKKDGSGKTELSLSELKDTLEILTLRKELVNLRADVAELKKRPQIKEKDIIDQIKDIFIRKGDLLNFSHASSIEKLKSVPEGVLYYKKGVGLRCKSENGWTTLIAE